MMKYKKGSQVWLSLRSLWNLSMYCWLIKRRPYSWLQSQQGKAMATHISRSLLKHEDALQCAESLHEAVRLAARALPFKADCLPRSFVLRDALHKRGIDAKVLIGVAKNTEPRGGILSHAWVEVDGKPVRENDDLKTNFRVIESAADNSA